MGKVLAFTPVDRDAGVQTSPERDVVNLFKIELQDFIAGKKINEAVASQIGLSAPAAHKEQIASEIIADEAIRIMAVLRKYKNDKYICDQLIEILVTNQVVAERPVEEIRRNIEGIEDMIIGHLLQIDVLRRQAQKAALQLI